MMCEFFMTWQLINRWNDSSLVDYNDYLIIP